MRNETELAAASHENLVASFRKIVAHSPQGESREARAVFAFVSGLPLSFFNGCVVTGAAEPEEVDEALGWVRGRGVPSRVCIAGEHAEELAGVVSSHGYGERTPYPGMALHPVPEPPEPAAPITVERVADEEGRAAFVQVSVLGGLSADLADRLFSPSLAADTDVALFLGRLDGRPAGTSLAIRSASASGVSNVGTLPAARRRGLGTALTWAAVAAGSSWGLDTIVLQSSAMGLSLYTTMGFRTVAPYVLFSRPPER